MDKVVIPEFAEGKAEPISHEQELINEMINLTLKGLWCRDTTRDNEGRMCTMGMISYVYYGETP